MRLCALTSASGSSSCAKKYWGIFLVFPKFQRKNILYMNFYAFSITGTLKSLCMRSSAEGCSLRCRHESSGVVHLLSGSALPFMCPSTRYSSVEECNVAQNVPYVYFITLARAACGAAGHSDKDAYTFVNETRDHMPHTA